MHPARDQNITRVRRALLDAAAAILLIVLTRPATAQMSIHGAFDAGDDGSAQYSINIPAPPGVAGLQPHLALTYHSTGGNGLLGMGWSLSGLSSIARCPQTWAQDGLNANGSAPGGIHFNDNDRLCLDGQRLLPVTPATSSQGGTEFRTEIDGFSRIIAFGSDPVNPTSIQVESKSGLISTYGQTPDSNVSISSGSTVTRQWALKSVRDRLGHTMTVTYSQNMATGDFRPAEIDYTWPSDGVSVGATVLFQYTTRPDVSRTYIWGSMLQNQYLISEIDTELKTAGGSTQPVTQYHMYYTTAPTGSTNTTLQTSLLDHIQVCAGSAPDCSMPPVQFTYTTGTVVANTPGVGLQQLVYSGTEINWTDQVYRGDFLGKGVDALLVTAGPNCAFTSCWQGYKIFSYDTSGLTLVASGTTPDGSTQNFYVADLLGTGKPGIVTTAANDSLCGYAVYFPDKNGYLQPAPTAGNAGICGSDRIFAGNFLGTGQMALLVTSSPYETKVAGGQDLFYYQSCSNYDYLPQGACGFYYSGWSVYRYDSTVPDLVPVAQTGSSSSGYTGDPSLPSAGPDAEDRILVATFAGDGTSQVLTICDPCGYGQMSFYGEGISDAVSGASGTPWVGWRLYSFDGHNFNLVSSGSSPDRYSDVYPGNFGGDGKASLFVVPHYANKANTSSWNGWQLWRSTGNGFVEIGSGGGLAGGEQFFVADLNGDGRDGVLVLGSQINQTSPDPGWTVLQSDGFNMINAASGSWPSNGETATVGSFFRQSGSGVIITSGMPNNWNGWKLYNSNWQQPRFMLTGINNGAVNTTITYQALNTPGVHTPSTGAVYPQMDINPSVPVVTAISTDDGAGGQRTNSYSYAGLRADQTGRGLLGFASTTSVQNEAHATVVKTFSQSFPYTGAVTNLSGYITPPGGSQVQTSSAAMTYGCETSSTSSYAGGCSAPAPGQHYFVYKASTTAQTWDLNGAAFQPQTVTSTFADNWGNETQTQTTTGDGYTETVTRQFGNDVTDWLLGRLTQSSDQRTSP